MPLPSVEIAEVTAQGSLLRIGDEAWFVAFAAFPWFGKAAPDRLLHVDRPATHHLRWPELDIDLDVDSPRHPERYPLVSRI